MLNIILAIFSISFLPVFMLGNLKGVVQQIPNKPVEVLGEASQKNATDKECASDDSQKVQNYNLFPLNQPDREAIVPTRKSDYADIKIWSRSSVVLDADSGTILEYSNGRKKTQIASLTKLMTAVLVMENIKNLDEEVTITKEALNVPATVVGCPMSGYCVSNKMYAGEKISALNLLKAMLLDSANDAATALAIHVSGSEEKFAKSMNEKAKSLGLKDTNFCRASGLEIGGKESQCFSSAYDIARIASYSLQYEKIWEIMRIQETQIFSTDGKYMHQLKNTNLLLSEMPNCIGGKTGLTPLAGKSLLLAAADETKKHRIIAVILDDEKRWENMRILVSWVFDNYQWE